ncbi:hypothetical protein VNI00_016942 [Paramarasmius palmivorus]|uniref:Uncharacterized protein n=1 Tax=Paramarasmius palmivorus TaxID=297713 RepID=A0AAW0BC54_9AGAR
MESKPIAFRQSTKKAITTEYDARKENRVSCSRLDGVSASVLARYGNASQEHLILTVQKLHGRLSRLSANLRALRSENHYLQRENNALERESFSLRSANRMLLLEVENLREELEDLAPDTDEEREYATISLSDAQFEALVRDSLKQLFGGRTTRSQNYYSPYLLTTDESLDARLVEALNAHDDPYLDSPLTTPPSSPPSSPDVRSSVITELMEDIPELNLPRSSTTDSTPHRRNTSRNKKKGHERRKARRKLGDVLVFAKDPRRLKEHKIRLTTLSRAAPVSTEIQDSHLHPTSSGYLGTQRPLPERRSYSKDELLAMGFQLHPHNPDSTCPILHAETGSVTGLIVPGPRSTDPGSQSWDETIAECTAMIERLRPRCNFKPPRPTPKQKKMAESGSPIENLEHERRGNFKFLNYGISYGNGQTVMASLIGQYSNLHLPFSKCVFAAFTVNFGPETICHPHLDLKNLAYGWCAITALGDFDWRCGGHLVLWDLKLVIEFPPGTTIFIPSALITHSNTSISPGEKRYSFTLYSAGGLFRWVEHGFVTEKIYQATLAKAQALVAGVSRWVSGFALFSTLSELKESVPGLLSDK